MAHTLDLPHFLIYQPMLRNIICDTCSSLWLSTFMLGLHVCYHWSRMCLNQFCTITILRLGFHLYIYISLSHPFPGYFYVYVMFIFWVCIFVCGVYMSANKCFAIKIKIQFKNICAQYDQWVNSTHQDGLGSEHSFQSWGMYWNFHCAHLLWCRLVQSILHDNAIFLRKVSVRVCWLAQVR